MIILSITWDTLFHHSANGIAETLICLIPSKRIRLQQSPGKFVCESNIVAQLGLAEVSLLYKLAWYRTSKPRWGNKRGLMLRPQKLF